MIFSCRVCNSNKIDNTVSFGLFPVSHKFKKNFSVKSKKFKLDLIKCKNCNLVQIKKKVPLKELVPIYKWIAYNEPEDHLDYLVKKISLLRGINFNSTIIGIGYKEKTIISRFKKVGYKKSFILDSKNDLEIKKKIFNLETIQNQLTSRISKKVKKNYNTPSIIIARHILEHSYDIEIFLNFFKTTIDKNGYIVFEVPDCENSLKKIDYTMLWEEHIFYFTKSTLYNLLVKNGFRIISLESYSYPYESILIAIVKPADNKDCFLKFKNEELLNFNQKKILKCRLKINNYFKKIKKSEFKIICFGTGHVMNIFIHSLKIKNFIDYAVDDNINKKNLYLPGTKINIKNSEILSKEKKFLCLMSLNYSSEKKIFKKIKNLKSSKRLFFSIYPNSKNYLKCLC